MARRRRCAFCSELLPKDARPNRKYCDADCRAGKRGGPPDVEQEPQRGCSLLRHDTVAARLQRLVPRHSGDVGDPAGGVAHEPTKKPEVELGPVAAATEESIAAAPHLAKIDAGAIATLRFLAKKIDTEDQLRDLALKWAEENKQKPPAVDNVSIPTYLKYCESLGLTPNGRLRFEEKPKEESGGKLATLRAVSGGKKGRSA